MGIFVKTQKFSLIPPPKDNDWVGFGVHTCGGFIKNIVILVHIVLSCIYFSK